MLASFGTVTLALVPACIAAIASVVAAYIAHYRGNKAAEKVHEIKLLVNGRLDEALHRIIELEGALTSRQLDKLDTTAEAFYNEEEHKNYVAPDPPA